MKYGMLEANKIFSDRKKRGRKEREKKAEERHTEVCSQAQKI